MNNRWAKLILMNAMVFAASFAHAAQKDKHTEAPPPVAQPKIFKCEQVSTSGFVTCGNPRIYGKLIQYSADKTVLNALCTVLVGDLNLGKTGTAVSADYESRTSTELANEKVIAPVSSGDQTSFSKPVNTEDSTLVTIWNLPWKFLTNETDIAFDIITFGDKTTDILTNLSCTAPRP